MATSVAPGYFDQYQIADPGDVFHRPRAYGDGGLLANMPLAYVLDEKEMVWPRERGIRPLDIAVSIGTGYWDPFNRLSFFFDTSSKREVGKAYHDILNAEKTWQAFKADPQRYQESVHYRINVRLSKKVDMDDYKAMDELQQLVQKHVRSVASETIDKIAFQLVASLLYFEPVERVGATRLEREYIQGYIYCRLLPGSPPALRLVSRLEGFHHQERRGWERVRYEKFWDWKSARSFTWTEIKRGMQEERRPRFAVPYIIHRTDDPVAEQCVYANLWDSEGERQEICRISGFPISYLGLLEIMDKRRGVQ